MPQPHIHTLTIVAAVVWILVGMIVTIPITAMVMMFGAGENSARMLVLGLFPILIMMSGVTSLVTAARNVHPLWPVLILATPLICPLIDYATAPGGDLAKSLSDYGRFLKFWQFLS